jgi:molybdate transport system substrate-binding protein
MHYVGHKLLLWLALCLVALGCAPAADPWQNSPQTVGAPELTTLTVFAAASLAHAFNEIGEKFAVAHPGAEVIFNFAGSNQLATQIGQGAPVDVFASANQAQMTVAIEVGRILTDTVRTFAQNRLVVIAPGDNPAGLTALADLAKPEIQLVFAIQEAPVGQYTLDFLDKAATEGSLGAGYQEAVLANVVSYEENVRAVLAKVMLGEADAGIVYTSDVAASPEGALIPIEIPDPLTRLPATPSPHCVIVHTWSWPNNLSPMCWGRKANRCWPSMVLSSLPLSWTSQNKNEWFYNRYRWSVLIPSH